MTNFNGVMCQVVLICKVKLTTSGERTMVQGRHKHYLLEIPCEITADKAVGEISVTKEGSPYEQSLLTII